MSQNKKKVIAGLDIGSSKVTVIISTVKEDPNLKDNQTLEIVGVGTAPNFGIRQGVVVNIEATTDAIRRAREEAELMSGYRIEEVWVGVSGSHIKSFDSKGMVAIKNKEVTAQDVDRVIEAGKAVAVPTDRQVLHVLPREYKVDTQDGILDPIGMSGIRLEANVHIVTGSQTAIANNLKCIEKSGLKVIGMVLDPLATAQAVLSEDERTLGVCVIDMGAGSCKAIYYVNGSVAHTSVIPVGGQHFTHDIAIGLRTPQIAAEEIKRKYGCAMSSLVGEDEVVEVEGVGGRKARTVLRRDLSEVLEPRAEETLQLIQNDIQMSGLAPLMGSGVVLTGGASQMEGMLEMAEFILDLPVRKGLPVHANSNVGGLVEVVRSPAFSTAVGILRYGLTKKRFTKASSTAEIELPATMTNLGQKIKNIIEDLF